MSATPESATHGDGYRLMVLAALEKQSGAAAHATLTCGYTHAKNAYEFLMWAGFHPVGPKLHTLLASVTTQERLDEHWQGFVDNLGKQPSARTGAPPLHPALEPAQ
jgi:hypothetical protein